MPKKKSQSAELLRKVAKLLEGEAPKFEIFVAVDDYEMRVLHHASAMLRVLNTFAQELRSALKHGDPDAKHKTPRDAVEYWRDRLFELIREEDIPDDVLY